MSDKGQNLIVSAIYRAYKNFRERNANQADLKLKGEKSDSIPPRIIVGGHVKGFDTTQVVRKPEKEIKTPGGSLPLHGLSYKVQIAASVDKPGVNDPRLVKFDNVKMYQHGGMYKYTVGDESTLRAAENLLDEVRRKGVTDAFIVIFRNGSRIPQDEAKRLLKK